MLDRITSALAGRERFVAVFTGDVRLVDGSAVWLGGREVGVVEGVDFLPASGDTVRVAVTMAVPDDLVPHIRRDSHVRITSARMIGTPAIDIVPGSPDAGPLAPGDTLYAQRTITSEELMASVALLRSESAQLVADMAALEEPLARRAAVLDGIVQRFTRMGTAFDALAAAFQSGPLSRALGDEGLPALLEQLQATVAAVSPALERAAGRFTDPETRATMDALRTRTAALNSALGVLRAEIARTGGGMLARMQTDSALAKAIHGVRAQLDSLIAEAKENPMRFVF